MRLPRFVACSALATLTLAGSLAAQKPPPAPPTAPDLKAKLDPQMREVIDAMDESKARPIFDLKPADARKEPTAADAAKAVLKKRGQSTSPEPVAGGTNDEKLNVGLKDNVPVRFYYPAKGDGPFPAVVYFHGGGWVLADYNVYDSSARALANASGAVVVSVNYRLAPEHRFPAAPEDCYAVFNFLATDRDGLAKKYKINPASIAVAGESAGGNLATVVSMMAKEKGTPMPKHQLLVYPVADYPSTQTASAKENGKMKPLVVENMPWFWNYYLPEGEGAKNDAAAKPHASPLRASAEQLKGLPPATVITAQYDVLRDEAEAYGKKLQAAGVSVTMKRFDGVTHEFFGMGAVLDKAKEAVALGGGELKKGLSGSAAMPPASR